MSDHFDPTDPGHGDAPGHDAHEPEHEPHEGSSAGEEGHWPEAEHDFEEAPDHQLGPDELSHHPEPRPDEGHSPLEVPGDSASADRSAEQAILHSPGGTVFDPIPAGVEPWLEHAESGWHAAADEHYAAAWAHDDGTGRLDAIGPPQDAEDDLDPGEHAAGLVPSHAAEVLYGGDAGLGDTAARLWAELAPGTPPPVDDHGEPLMGAALLRELAEHVDDPVTRSVVDAALVHASR